MLEPFGPVDVVCNSAASARVAVRLALPHRDVAENLGFGRAANAMASGDRRGTAAILILNDDTDLSDLDSERLHASITRAAGPNIVLCGRPDDEVATPGILGVLARVSGTWALRRLLPSGLRGRTSPFHAVLVGWEAWDRLGGFDTDRFPLYYEDADFIRRAEAAGIDVHVNDFGVAHVGSQTSREHPALVEVSSFGALNYMSSQLGVNPRVATALIRAALVVRIATSTARGRLAESRASARALVTPIRKWHLDLPGYR